MENKNNKKEPIKDIKNKKLEDTEKKLLSQITGVNNYDSDSQEYEEFQDALDNFFDSHKSLKNNNYVELLTANTLNNMDKNKRIKDRSMGNKKKVARKVLEEQTDWGTIFKSEQERCDRYSDYKLIYDYIPELRACIDGFTDSVIAPDDISGNKLSVVYRGKPLNEKNKFLDNSELDDLENKINNLIKKYDLTNLQREIIRDTYIYGDKFINIQSISNSFEDLLLREENNEYIPPSMREKAPSILIEDNQINENDIWFTEGELETLYEDYIKTTVNGNAIEKINDYSTKITNHVVKMINDIEIKGAECLYDSTKKDINKFNSKTGQDLSKRIDKLNIDGSIIKNINQKYVIKLEMDGVNFGYIYARSREKIDSVDKTSSAGAFFQKDFFNAGINSVNEKSDREEILTKILTRGLSKKINLDFLEDNKEFKDFILVLLKNNILQKNKVDFIYFSDSDLVHSAIDKDGIYGTSRLANSLFFAKLYLATLMNDMMQKLTRGRDKRVIYVEVGIDEAIEEAIQQVVRDLRSKEIQSSVLKNITTMFKQVGNFEDYVIPVVDGEHNVDFDTISGIK